MNKLERLFAITLYLLNHGRVSALQLAERYEVSLRTIQRDIDALTLAGIPVISYIGANGGYEMMESYRMHAQLGNEDDYRYIQIALQGLMSAFQEKGIAATMEKVNALDIKDEPHMILDFGALKERQELNDYMNIIDQCIIDRKVLSFTYHGVNSGDTQRKVEPIYLIYRWYSWYLIAFDPMKGDYRCFKLIRMCEIHIEQEVIQYKEDDKATILQHVFSNDRREYYTILVYCRSDCDLKNMEYLNGDVVEIKDNQDYVMQFYLPKDEAAWKGTLLSYADKIKIISPDEVKDLLAEKVLAFLRNHDNMLS